MQLERRADGDAGTGPLPAANYRGVESALGRYLRAIEAHWLVFALVVLVCLGGAAGAINLLPRQYEAGARVLVSPVPQEDRTFLGIQVVRDAGEPTRTAQTAATLLESQGAAALTATRLRPSRTPSQVAAAVSVESIGESNVLSIRATAESREQASRIATQYARSALVVRGQVVRAQIETVLRGLSEQQRTIASSSAAASDLAARIVQLRSTLAQGDPTLTFDQEAGPGVVLGASSSLVLILALLAGVALGAAAAVLLDLSRTRVRDTEEARSLFPMPVLAVVPKLSKGTLRDASNGSFRLDGAALQAFRTVYLQLMQGEGGGRAIMLTSASSGDGNTTSAVSLASSIAFTGKRVILMDCDLRSPSAGRLLGIETHPPTAHKPSATMDEMLVSVPGMPLSVLSVGPPSLDGLEPLVNRLPTLLQAARLDADIVVIDTAPLGGVSDALSLLRDVDDVIVVTRPGHTDRREYEVMRDLIQRMTASVRGMVVVGVGPDLPSAHSAQSAAHGQPTTRRQGRL